MKLVKTIVRPDKVDEVRDALEKIKISGMTVTDVRGHGRQKGHTAVYRGKEYSVTLLPKVQVEVVVPDNVVEEVIQTIIAAARTGEIGDGRVFVLPVEQGYNIRTGERDSGVGATLLHNDVRHIRWAHKNVEGQECKERPGQSGREGPGFGPAKFVIVVAMLSRRPARWR